MLVAMLEAVREENEIKEQSAAARECWAPAVLGWCDVAPGGSCHAYDPFTQKQKSSLTVPHSTSTSSRPPALPEPSLYIPFAASIPRPSNLGAFARAIQSFGLLNLCCGKSALQFSGRFQLPSMGPNQSLVVESEASACSQY